MAKIWIRDYTKLSPKGRAAGSRYTTYTVADETDFEDAYRQHNAAIAAGTLSTPVKIAGWGRDYS